MKPVSRHVQRTRELEGFYSRCSDDLGQAIELGARNPSALNIVADIARDVFVLASIVDEGMLSEHARVAAELRAAFFHAVLSPHRACELTLRGQQIVVSASQVPADQLHFGSWLEAYYLSAIVNDHPALDVLCSTPREIFFQATIQPLEDADVAIALLKSYWVSKPDPELIRQMETIYTGGTHGLLQADWLVDIGFPHYRLLVDLCQGGQRFTQLCYDALRSFKRYWTKSTQRRRNFGGYLPVEIAGLCRLARTKGIRFTVDSDYLPALCQ